LNGKIRPKVFFELKLKLLNTKGSIGHAFTVCIHIKKKRKILVKSWNLISIMCWKLCSINLKILPFSIDATTTTSRLGHFVNDSEDFNCEARIVVVNEDPHVCLFATNDIEIGTELRYHYGDHKRKLWWRKEVKLNYLVAAKF